MDETSLGRNSFLLLQKKKNVDSFTSSWKQLFLFEIRVTIVVQHKMYFNVVVIVIFVIMLYMNFFFCSDETLFITISSLNS